MPIEHWSIKDVQNVQNARFIYFACNTAWTWDVITSISDEVDVFKGRRVTLVDAVYAFSRLFTGLAIYFAFPFITLPLEDCDAMAHTVGWLGGAAGSFTTLLFLFRANSVYYDSVSAKVHLTCMWLIAAVGHLVFPLTLSSLPLPPNSLCVVESIEKFSVASISVVAIFDWAIFCCIAFRVVQMYAPDTQWQEKCRIFITGAGTSSIPRTLLRTGHFYILSLLCLHFCVLWFRLSTTFEPLVSYQYQAISIFAALLSMNSMACRVFRSLRQLKINGSVAHLVDISTLRFRQNTLGGGAGTQGPVETGV